MDGKYYYLKQGEIIQEGDEVEMSANYNDDAKWQKAAPHTVGTPAPDHRFMAHRTYRRWVSDDDEIQWYINATPEQVKSKSAILGYNLDSTEEQRKNHLEKCLELARFNVWKENLIKVTNEELKERGITPDFKINNNAAYDLFASEMSPYQAFRESYG